MELFTASGAGDIAAVTKLLGEGVSPDLGDTWTGNVICKIHILK